MQGRTVLICGAGIAGPTLAYWLNHLGFAPTILERAPALRTSGYVIDFWGLGYDIAEKMGLLPDILREGYHVQEVRIVDERGTRISGFGTKVFDDLTGGRFISLKRSDLSRVIFTKVADGCEVIFGDSINGIFEDESGVRITFERGKERRFDLVIGADGLHSTVRTLAFGPQEKYEKHLGYTVAAFEISGYRPRDDNVYVIYERPGRQVGRFALRDDSTLFLFVLARDLGPVSYPNVVGAQKAFLRSTFAHDEWEVPQNSHSARRLHRTVLRPRQSDQDGQLVARAGGPHRGRSFLRFAARRSRGGARNDGRVRVGGGASQGGRRVQSGLPAL